MTCLGKTLKILCIVVLLFNLLVAFSIWRFLRTVEYGLTEVGHKMAHHFEAKAGEPIDLQEIFRFFLQMLGGDGMNFGEWEFNAEMHTSGQRQALGKTSYPRQIKGPTDEL